jgi:hypothetical protein
VQNTDFKPQALSTPGTFLAAKKVRVYMVALSTGLSLMISFEDLAQTTGVEPFYHRRNCDGIMRTTLPVQVLQKFATKC